MDSAKFARPPSYPAGGTYADLLFWHLYVWGTRPGGSVTERGARLWTEEEFLKSVFSRDKGTPESQPKNYDNWIGKSKYCLSPGPYYGPIISGVIFAGELHFQIWQNDLEKSQETSSGKGNNKRTIELETALTELARAGLISQLATPTLKTFSRDNGRRYIATAAQESVTLVTKRLTEFFAGRSYDIHVIDHFVTERMSRKNNGLLVITAPPGFGKSALAAHWCNHAAETPQRRVAKHFCSVTIGEATTSLENVYAHLHHQIAEHLGEPIDQSRSFDALAGLLSKPPPGDRELVVWVDGIEEADGKIACFLPRTLAERVCIIISARAEARVIPAYLAPWLDDPMAMSHEPRRHDLSKLSFSDVAELVKAMFAASALEVPGGLALRIFRASDDGYALFARHMTETAIEAVKAGNDIDLGNARETLRGYAIKELVRLEGLKEWPELADIFAFLTIAREAVSIDEFAVLIGRRVFPRTFPTQLMRWLAFIESPRRKNPPLLSFAHPLLAEVFGQALGGDSEKAHHELCDAIKDQPYDRLPTYAWHHWPQHLVAAGRMDEAALLLQDLDFIEGRFDALGVETTPTQMASDFRAWYRAVKQGGRK